MSAMLDPHIALPLWEGQAPLAHGDGAQDIPGITVYLPSPEIATGAGVVICPGGGYGHLADHEGAPVARWLAARGVAGLVLTYRIAPRYRHPAPLLDAERAMRLARDWAHDWGLHRDAIGIMGFSAGGHLATTAATHHTHGDAMAEDRVEHHPSAPSFLIAIYPVVTLAPPYGHMGSRHNLLGHEASEATVASLCNATQVTPTTPPTFLVHTWEDTAVPAENSIEFYLALRKAGVRAEMHLYEQGHHGFGMAIDRRGPPWTPALEAWMRVHGWMK